ncbi:Uncharacterized protein EbC_38890 [Erwinia billingiae Eb661]|uniref:Uncharacterized protein n=1 Tax=Erwinia billingiae (strain Eb661) TaxID=634500 RepID=D8MX63_ERWBE|nr:Uncharacterized protein EbC_38890 [Erwinia billingiae Eb661]
MLTRAALTALIGKLLQNINADVNAARETLKTAQNAWFRE